MPHSFDLRVYYEDTDAGGVVYYANYLKFAERARTEWLRAKGFDQSQLMQTDGIMIVVRRCTVDFLAPARLDDALEVQTRLKEIGKVRMTMQQTIMRAEKELVRVEVELACVNLQGKPTGWPASITSALEI